MLGFIQFVPARVSFLPGFCPSTLKWHAPLAHRPRKQIRRTPLYSSHGRAYFDGRPTSKWECLLFLGPPNLWFSFCLPFKTTTKGSNCKKDTSKARNSKHVYTYCAICGEGTEVCPILGNPWEGCLWFSFQTQKGVPKKDSLRSRMEGYTPSE